MVKYLHFENSEAGYLKTPTLTFDEVILDILVDNSKNNENKYYLDARTGMTNGYFSRNLSPFVDDYGSSWSTVKLNGVTKNNQTLFVPDNQRVTLQLIANADYTDNINIFTRNTDNFMRYGNIYDVILKLNGAIVARYDMSTGNVQDVSGNGRHATLVGGTWLDDGTGGTQITASYVSKQLIYAPREVVAQSKQALYRNTLGSQSLAQALYKDGVTSVNTKQSINKGSVTNFDTLVELYDTSVTIVDKFTLQVQLYRQGSMSYSLTQRLYKEITDVKAAVHNLIFTPSSTNVSTTQILSKLAAVNVTLKQALYKANSADYATLQQLLNDWNEYREVIRIVLEIQTSAQLDLTISTAEQLPLEITQRINI